MKKQKSSSRQDISRVHPGGKFVALDAESEARQSVSRKKQAEKILATVVMGMNLVNSLAPLADLAGAKPQEELLPQLREAEVQYVYEVLPQLAGYVDEMIFSTAEAYTTVNSGESSTFTSNRGGITVLEGGTAIIGNNTDTLTVSGGNVSVANNNNHISVFGGYAEIGSNANQIWVSGGTCSVGTHTMYEEVFGGTAIIGTLDGTGLYQVYQSITGGSGHIDTMAGVKGWQNINDGGAGSIDMMEGGSQWIRGSATGTIGTMSGGQQMFFSGSAGVASIGTMLGGTQRGAVGCETYIDTMVNGRQYAQNVGQINTMSSGLQFVGWYTEGSSHLGKIVSMLGGQQQVCADAVGIIDTMNGASATQIVGRKGSNAVGSIGVLQAGAQAVGYGSGNSGMGYVSLMEGGSQIIAYSGGSGSGIVTTMQGGMQIVESGGIGTVSALQGGLQQVKKGGTAFSTTVSSGGMQYIEAGAVISGTVLDGGTLQLNQDSSDFTLSNALTVNGGIIDMTDGTSLTFSRSSRAAATYETLTISDLQGSGGSVRLDTDLAGGNSDKLVVDSSNTGTGSYNVYIKDVSPGGTELTGQQLVLITDESSKLNFRGAKANAGGLWDVDPTLAKQGNDWYLTKLEKTANNDTLVLLDAADNSYALWRNTNDSLRSRLGALASGSEQSDGIWARTQAGRFSGDNYEGRYNLYQLGFDQAADAKSVYGAAVDYGDGTGSYDNGSGKDKLKSFSLYGVWTGDNGAYTNVTARYGMVSTDLESYGDYPDKAEYKQHAYSVSVEYGKRFDMERGFFIEPQAQFTLGRLGSISYTTDRGANGYIEGLNSAIGRIGFVMGQKITGDNDIYLKADLLHEFAGERDLQLTSDAGGTNDILTKHNDYGDTWFELGLGANIKVSKTASVYGEVERGFGGDINKKWSVNGGVRFTF